MKIFKDVMSIYKREFLIFKRSTFLQSISVLFLLIAGYIFHSLSFYYVKIEPYVFIKNLTRLGILFIPLFTMNSIAKDKLTGELEIIMAAGMKPFHYVLGKFKFIQAQFLVFTIFFLIFPWVYKVFGFVKTPVQLDLYLIALLGYFLISSFYISLGVFISSFNHYPASAAGITLGMFLLCFFLETFPVFFPESGFSEVLKFLLPDIRVQNFLYGIITLSDIIYFSSFIITFIFGANLVVKWKKY